MVFRRTGAGSAIWDECKESWVIHEEQHNGKDVQQNSRRGFYCTVQSCKFDLVKKERHQAQKKEVLRTYYSIQFIKPTIMRNHVV